MRAWIKAAAAALALLGVSVPAAAQTARNIQGELVSSRNAIAPGETFTLVLRQKVRPGWHIYWINPGDSGEPTRATWTLPAGYQAGELLHPAPRVERLGPIVTYVHDGDVLYPVAISAPADARIGGEARIGLTTVTLVCDEICVPEQNAFQLTLPIRAKGADDSQGAALAQRAIDALPQALSGVGVGLKATAQRIEVALPESASANPVSEAVTAGALRAPLYFPYSQSLIDHAAEQKASLGGGQVRFAMTPSLSFDPAKAQGFGLLSAEVREGARWTRRAFMFGKPPGEGPVPALVAARWSGAAPSAPPPAASAGAVGGLFAAMGLAFVGGLILNVMPCVFPVLSIKALSFAGGAQAGVARRQGLLFFAGAMTTFLALAGVLLALRAAGAAAGWGFQLQEPAIIATLALLFFLIALNFIGAFEIGGALQNAGAGLAARGGDAGAFFTGTLAVVAASPCTAPFMAGALGWAATQSAPASLATFAALGAGFATPFTALAFAPALHKRLPKPGPWMARVRQALAFPMFGAAVWLVWVLAVQTGATGAAAILALFVAAGFAVWTWRQGGIRWRAAGAAALGLIAVGAWQPMTTVAPAEAAAAATDAWSPARVAELTAAGTPVFVNFTAAWCVSCKVNEAVALSRPAVREAMAAEGVVYLKADWTARDPVIAEALAAYGRAGVPLYLFYPAGGKAPRVLPQLLTEDIVIDAIAKREPAS
jgi:thiol:disulfide interchange protein DsbD